MNDPFKDYVAAQIKPLLERLATVEMVVTILANKINDAECRAALIKFCGMDRESDPVLKTNGQSNAIEIPPRREPVAQLQGTGKTIDLIMEYFRVIDPENFSEERTPRDIARYVGKPYATVFSCLSSHPDDFERTGRGLWKLRTVPANEGDGV